MDFDVEKLCRLCLKMSEDLEFIFGYEVDGLPVINIVKRVCDVRIFKNDGGPEK